MVLDPSPPPLALLILIRFLKFSVFIHLFTYLVIDLSIHIYIVDLSIYKYTHKHTHTHRLYLNHMALISWTRRSFYVFLDSLYSSIYISRDLSIYTYIYVQDRFICKYIHTHTHTHTHTQITCISNASPFSSFHFFLDSASLTRTECIFPGSDGKKSCGGRFCSWHIFSKVSSRVILCAKLNSKVTFWELMSTVTSPHCLKRLFETGNPPRWLL